MSRWPPGLQIVARLLPLTYAVGALDVAMTGGSPVAAIVDLGVLAAFTALFFGLATWALARRLA